MNFVCFEHINLSCRDIGVTQQFYQALFPDWKIRTQGPGWVHLGNDQFYVSLFEEPSQTLRTHIPYDSIGFNHVGLVIQDGDAMRATLEKQGIAYRELKDAPETKFRVYLDDPDGNEIELIEYQPVYALR